MLRMMTAILFALLVTPFHAQAEDPVCLLMPNRHEQMALFDAVYHEGQLRVAAQRWRGLRAQPAMPAEQACQRSAVLSRDPQSSKKSLQEHCVLLLGWAGLLQKQGAKMGRQRELTAARAIIDFCIARTPPGHSAGLERYDPKRK